LQLATGALILLGLALGTWANIFYDIWKLVQNLGSSKKEVLDQPEQENGESI
jgi:hypothetical protein